MQNADDSHQFFGIIIKIGKEIIFDTVISGAEYIIKYIAKKIRKIISKEHKNDIQLVEVYDQQTGELISTIIIRKLKDDGFVFIIIDEKTGKVYNEKI